MNKNSPKILAIETATEAFSVALHTGTEIIEHFAIAPMQHAELMLPNIEKLLADAGLELKQLDAIAVSVGPGSFTGVRLGVSAAQGLAFGANLPVIAISTLVTLAQGAYQEFGSTHILTAWDARMHEVYWAAYEVDNNGIMQSVVPDCLVKPDAIILPPQFEPGKWLGVGNGWQIYEEMLQKINSTFYSTKISFKISGLQSKLKDLIENNMVIKADFYPHAKYVAKLAVDAFAKGKFIAAPELIPIYLRKAVQKK